MIAVHRTHSWRNGRESGVNRASRLMAGPDNPFAGKLLAAADALVTDRGASGGDPDVPAFLRYLDYQDGDPAVRAARARLLRTAATFPALFMLPAPDAPGLVFVGGEVDPGSLGGGFSELPVGSLAGSGVTPQRAFESCVGEGIEYLSQFAQDGDRIETRTMLQRCAPPQDLRGRFIAALLAACDVDRGRPIGWVRLRRLPAGPDAMVSGRCVPATTADAARFHCAVETEHGVRSGRVAR